MRQTSRTCVLEVLAAALLTVAPAAALAGEAEIPLTSLQSSDKGTPLGTVRALDSDAGLVLRVEASGLVAGPNRLRLSDRPVCNYPLQTPGSEIAYRELGTLNADVTEDGTEPVKTSVTLPGLSGADLAGKALVIYAGGRYADTQPQSRDAPLQLACGFTPAR